MSTVSSNDLNLKLWNAARDGKNDADCINTVLVSSLTYDDLLQVKLTCTSSCLFI